MAFPVSRIARTTFAPSSAAVRAAAEPTAPVGPKTITLREAMLSEGPMLETNIKRLVGIVGRDTEKDPFRCPGSFCSRHLWDSRSGVWRSVIPLAP
jgi:hypothetical protein